MLPLDHYRFKDPKMSKQRYFLVPIWKKLFCTRASPNIGKFEDFSHDLVNAKLPSTA